MPASPLKTLSDPYPPSTDRQSVHVWIGSDDYIFFNSLFPKWGAKQKVLAELFHVLITELRSHNLDPNNPEHRAWHVEHPSLQLLISTLESIRGDSDRRIAGDESGQDESGGTGSVCPEVRHSAPVRPDSKGGTPDRTQSEDEKGGQCECREELPRPNPGVKTPPPGINQSLLDRLGLGDVWK